MSSFFGGPSGVVLSPSRSPGGGVAACGIGSRDLFFGTMVRIVPPGPGDVLDEDTQKWLDYLQPRLVNLEGFQLSADFPFDFSPASLGLLERVVIERCRDGDEVPDAEDPLVLGVIAYLGEAFIRVAGGRWAWIDGPVVCPDPALGLPAVRLKDLFTRAVDRGTGEEFAKAAEELAGAVRERRRSVPGWEPVRIAVPGVDDYELE